MLYNVLQNNKTRVFGNLSTGFHKIIKFQDISRTFPGHFPFLSISSTGKYFPDFPGFPGFPGRVGPC